MRIKLLKDFRAKNYADYLHCLLTDMSDKNSLVSKAFNYYGIIVVIIRTNGSSYKVTLSSGYCVGFGKVKTILDKHFIEYDEALIAYYLSHETVRDKRYAYDDIDAKYVAKLLNTVIRNYDMKKVAEELFER